MPLFENFMGLDALTMEAIKELKQENDDLKAELRQLKTEFERHLAGE